MDQMNRFMIEPETETPELEIMRLAHRVESLLQQNWEKIDGALQTELLTLVQAIATTAGSLHSGRIHGYEVK